MLLQAWAEQLTHMDIIHTADIPWGESLVRQRGGNIAHKLLFEGEEGSPDNYMLVLAREANDYFSPRHCHPWDQLRYCFEGAIPIGHDTYVEDGDMAYFPESVPYGPQEGGKDRIVMLLQFGGASGQGFIGPDRLNAARETLARSGRFEKGYYYSESEGEETRHDAYEAIWKHVTGKALAYADPVYKAPIVVRTSALPWQPTESPEIASRVVGDFPHRGLVIRQWQIAPGGLLHLPKVDGRRFLFVFFGAGKVNGEDIRDKSAIRLNEQETVRVEADAKTELMEICVKNVEPCS
jgi:hypothetical protein